MPKRKRFYDVYLNMFIKIIDQTETSKKYNKPQYLIHFI